MALDDKLHWYKDAIIYELHIKAFNDGNGDGIGDFQGLLEKLNYLEDLGVTAVWVLPFYPSPLRDDGYDIADYYRVNNSYGDIRQFKQFLKEAHKRNLKVITELVINHTSDQHPWFQRARSAPKGSVARNYYVWTDDPNKYKGVRIIFQDFETSNWTWDPVAQQYYWHRFFSHQPDLNYDNPSVQEEVFRIIDYWCKMGVDGFRLDAVPYLFERDDTNCENLPETHVFLKKLRKHVDERFPGTMFLAEANMWPEDSASYFGNGDECHMNYNFPVMPRMFMALRMEDRYPITDIFDQTPSIPETCQWAIFLRNHDELTLEMVTDEERDYMYKVYARDPEAKINLGIRHRLAPLMDNNRRKIELMNYLLFSLPGTPVIYYGDEIGMGDNFYLGDRNGVRTPMQWSPDRNAGFSETNPQKLYLPVILDPEYHFESVNVETQNRNPSSLLWYMKRVINMRKKYKAFGRGDMKFMNAENPKVLAFTRSYEDETVLVVVNLSRFSQAAELDLETYKDYVPVEVFSRNKFPAIREKSPYLFTLGPHAYHWFELHKNIPESDKVPDLPELSINTWKNLVESEGLEALESKILPLYLQKVKWFQGRMRNIYDIKIVNNASIPLPEASAFILLIEVNYEQGLPETYQLHVINVKEKFADKLKRNSPNALICKIWIGETESYLGDAFYAKEYRQAFLSRLVSGRAIQFNKTEIHFTAGRVMRKYFRENPETKSKILSADHYYTSIGYDNRYFLKVYRKIDRGTNPDVELTRFLSEESEFENVPPYSGEVDWNHDRDSIALAMIQEMVEYHGDGWTYMLERQNNFNERILSRERESLPEPVFPGRLIDALPFDQLPENIKEFIGGTVAEQVRLMGLVTGKMHNSFASSTDKDFRPEDFSLHYQRSLFSGLQSLVRAAFNQSKNLRKLSDEVRVEAQQVLGRKDEVVNVLRKIYQKKLDASKIRIHGDFHLGQILLTGKDMVIRDFSGDPTAPYSERRLKRSPLIDVADMIRSFWYAPHGTLMQNHHIRKEDIPTLIPYTDFWIYHTSAFFLNSYLGTVRNSSFIPKDREDINTLLRVFLLEKALESLYYELNYRPEWAIVPVRMIKAILL